VVLPSAGEVVLVPFPFSDLSTSKVRPAVCLADAGRGDWVLCQITSSPYGDPSAVPLVAARNQLSPFAPRKYVFFAVRKTTFRSVIFAHLLSRYRLHHGRAAGGERRPAGQALYCERGPHGEIGRHPLSRRARPDTLGGRSTLSATIGLLTSNSNTPQNMQANSSGHWIGPIGDTKRARSSAM
jgi:hypothetical protein